MKAYTYTPDGDGKGKEGDIPADLADAAQSSARRPGRNGRRRQRCADGRVLRQGHASGGAHDRGLRAGHPRNAALPRPVRLRIHQHRNRPDPELHRRVLPVAASAIPCTPPQAIRASTERSPTASPVRAFVFKTTADPFAGRITFFKVYSGVVKNDANLQNVRTQFRRAAGAPRRPVGQDVQPVTELHAGDIGAVAKLKDTLTGDTLARQGLHCRRIRPVKLPEPSIAFAIEAKSRNDEDRMGNAVHRILEEDQSLRFYRDPQTREFLLAGAGQQHVEIVVSRLKKRYGVDVALKAPKIPYRETIRGKADVQGRHKKQTGGHGQFGDCWIRMEPLPRGAKFEFANEIFGGSIPKNFIPAVEKGIWRPPTTATWPAIPMVDFKVTVYDGSYHDVDSSELAFKLAARKAFKAAMQQAKPALLEPIMNVEIQAPVEYAGDLMGDLNGRRGRISGMDTKGATQIHPRPGADVGNAQLSERSHLHDAGPRVFTMEFDHYDYVP